MGAWEELVKEQAAASREDAIKSIKSPPLITLPFPQKVHHPLPCFPLILLSHSLVTQPLMHHTWHPHFFPHCPPPRLAHSHSHALGSVVRQTPLTRSTHPPHHARPIPLPQDETVQLIPPVIPRAEP